MPDHDGGCGACPAGGSTAGSDTAAPDARNPHLVPAAARPEAIYHYCVHAFIAGGCPSWGC